MKENGRDIYAQGREEERGEDREREKEKKSGVPDGQPKAGERERTKRV